MGKVLTSIIFLILVRMLPVSYYFLYLADVEMKFKGPSNQLQVGELMSEGNDVSI